MNFAPYAKNDKGQHLKPVFTDDLNIDQIISESNDPGPFASSFKSLAFKRHKPDLLSMAPMTPPPMILNPEV